MEITGSGNGKNYPIIIGNNIIDKIGDYFSSSRKALIVIDNNVDKEYVEKIKRIGFDSFVYYTFGEKSKNIDCYLEMINILLDNHFSRNDLIISIGGGTTSDLSGYVSATFKRGLNLVNVPSTTLAMVDASIGGKNAIDYKDTKNSIGSFYDPSLVIVDLDILNTLDDKIFNEGLVEALKCGLIKDKKLFDLFLSKNYKDDLLEIITRSIIVKNEIVSNDYFDKGERKILNFGHTFAHALESYSNYKISHAEAVAFGMTQVTYSDDLNEVIKALNNLGVKYDFNINKKDLIKYIIDDKKSDHEYIDLVVLEKIGKAKIVKKKIIDLV